ncbi:MAG TPA: hypothetical protein VFA26_02810 [Gemmataceae bacterium]|nr:hypothetical protein [Gemmataceae bacterium]
MPPATSAQITVEPDVWDFLKRREAQEEFDIYRQIVFEVFPELLGIEVFLLADPDEDDRWTVMFYVMLPTTYPPKRAADRHRRLSELVIERLPPERYPDHVCSFAVTFPQG